MNPIVLIEDNEQDVLLTIRALNQNNFSNQIIVLKDGDEAINFFSSMTIEPQVILLDLKLPKRDGFEVLGHLRTQKKTKHIPVVILSTSVEETDVLRGYDGGANSYVRKPVDFNQFADAVKSLGSYWLSLNQTPRVC